MRIEKGLLLKDWGLLKSQGKGIIYVMIGGAALMVGALNNSVIDREESAACFGIYITVTMAIYVANMLAYDEMDHGFQYLFRCRSRKRLCQRKIYFQHFSGRSSLVTWSDNNNRSFNDRKLRNGSEKIGNDNDLGDNSRSRSYCIEHTGTIKI